MSTLEHGVNALKEQIDASVASFFSSCVHCGMCADACLFYTENPCPSHTPIHKLEPMRRVWQQEYTVLGKLGKALGLSKPVTDEELSKWQHLVYDNCSLCGRCSMVCPVGNDISAMVRKMREGMVAAGHAPDGLKGASIRTVETGSPMGLKLKALKAQIKHIENDTNLKIPIDQEGAEYLVMLSSMELINFPEYLEAVARILRQANKTWTLSSEAFEATNAGIQIGSSDIARTIVSRIVDAAEKLKVKTVISPECGHAYTALRWEGSNLIGHPYSFEAKHILEVLDDLREQGLLKTESKELEKMTFHDPCQLVRKGGVLKQPRNLMNMVADNFVEMQDHGKMNWCCGGGGGVGAIEEAEGNRLKAFKLKKRQLEDLEVDQLVTACANCRITLEEGLENYDVNLPVVGLTEMIAEHLVDHNPDKGDAA